MIERKSYIGKLDGVSGIWCDKKPKGLDLEKTITFYSADEGKVFVDKEGNILDCVVIQEGTNIADYVEIVKPKTEEEPERPEEAENV